MDDVNKFRVYRHIIVCRFVQWLCGYKLFIFDSHFNMVCHRCKIKSMHVPVRWRTD